MPATAKTAKKAKIGVLGASGYTGAELVRLLLRHPQDHGRRVSAVCAI
jgi:N-acetyl-gamma-glutamyl-phosphate reductase